MHVDLCDSIPYHVIYLEHTSCINEVSERQHESVHVPKSVSSDSTWRYSRLKSKQANLFNIKMQLVYCTDTRQLFGPTIEYISIHSVLTENVSIT